MKFFSAFVLLIGSFAHAENSHLPFEHFKSRVRDTNLSVRAAERRAIGAKERSVEGDLLTSPQFFASGATSSDRNEKQSPTTQGTKIEATSYELGLQQNTRIGLQAKASYLSQTTKVSGISPIFLSDPEATEDKAKLELTQSLWKNAFGRETRLYQEATLAAAKTIEAQEQFQIKMLLADAEVAYWRLALARALKQVAKESVERSKKIREISAAKVARGLVDKSDLLQAESGLKYRELEFQLALDEEKAAGRQFNSVMGREGDEVPETLDALPQIESEVVKNVSEMRADLLAQQEQLKSIRAQSELSIEKTKPTFEAFAQWTTNARDRSASSAQRDVWKYDTPSEMYGVRLVVPLDIGSVSRVKEGYASEIYAAELRLARKTYDSKREFSDLQQKLKESVLRYQLISQFEQGQKSKYDYERDKQSRGRSTIFMVLQFEQDYASAQMQKLRAQFEFLNIRALLKTYGSES